MFGIIQAKLQVDHPVSVFETLRSFTVPPYGMNENSIILLLVCFLAYKGNELYVFYEKEKLTPAILNKKIFKDNKLQFKELRNISIQINVNADINLVADLCKKIINNRFVENCAGLKKQLSELLQVEGSLPEDQLLIASAQSRNDDGIQLNKKIYDNLSKAKTILKDNQSKLIVHKFVKIFSYLPNTEGEIEEG